MFLRVANKIIITSLLSLFLLVSCGAGPDDMLSAYDNLYTSASDSSTTIDGATYVPGVYNLKCLLPNELYTADKQNHRRINAKPHYTSYDWFLEKENGSTYNDVLAKAGSYVVIQTNLLNQGNYILKCVAKNEWGDVYKDEATLTVTLTPTEE